MDGVQESLAGRVGLLHMSPLSQAEACGYPSEPFTVELERLLTRSKAVAPASIQEIFERIWRGGMPAIVSGAKKSRLLYIAAIFPPILTEMSRRLRIELILLNS